MRTLLDWAVVSRAMADSLGTMPLTETAGSLPLLVRSGPRLFFRRSRQQWPRSPQSPLASHQGPRARQPARLVASLARAIATRSTHVNLTELGGMPQAERRPVHLANESRSLPHWLATAHISEAPLFHSPQGTLADGIRLKVRTDRLPYELKEAASRRQIHPVSWNKW